MASQRSRMRVRTRTRLWAVQSVGSGVCERVSDTAIAGPSCAGVRQLLKGGTRKCRYICHCFCEAFAIMDDGRFLEGGQSMRGFWGTTALTVVLGLSGAAMAQAQEVQFADAGDITVTATRSEKDTFEVPSVVSVITDEEIEENLVTDIKDLIRF